ncbi:hypothetical protein B0H17DRAFT_1130783 [Mycena rosella]|uniref:Uncharacterized protein n=1 Tax=Mycena rosella TaxID=1033263 RepID=A0AAD7DRS7_MYCRO|nr:hypothetical protein B0H17DRAFT_1130783 [Mycena rosella]
MSGVSVPYNWGIPGIDIWPPPTSDGYAFTAATRAWNRPKLSPIGLYYLRRHLGVLTQEPGIFCQYQQRFITSNITWFAAGVSTDRNHILAPNCFFPEFDMLRSTLPCGSAGSDARKVLSEQLQTALFNLATSWDCTFGGTTMILHVDGTTIPNTPALLQYLRCVMYLPPLFVADNPASHRLLAQIAQLFIEAVGIPTVQKCPSATLVPDPQLTTSAYYRFHGRPVGVLDSLLNLPPVSPALGMHCNCVVKIPDDGVVNILNSEDEDYDDTSMDPLTALECVGYVETRVHELEDQQWAYHSWEVAMSIPDNSHLLSGTETPLCSCTPVRRIGNLHHFRRPWQAKRSHCPLDADKSPRQVARGAGFTGGPRRYGVKEVGFTGVAGPASRGISIGHSREAGVYCKCNELQLRRHSLRGLAYIETTQGNGPSSSPKVQHTRIWGKNMRGDRNTETRGGKYACIQGVLLW